jgi:ArsR family transcriptional regulator, arsenate/arsenite/antimonite-responsive transcriptional repressor
MNPEQLFRTLSDRTRLRCLLLLTAERELCVCEFVHILELSQPKVSRHLAQLRDQGLVHDQRRGQWVYYRLSPELPDWINSVLDTVRSTETLGPLRQRLSAMPNRPSVACD